MSYTHEGVTNEYLKKKKKTKKHRTEEYKTFRETGNVTRNFGIQSDDKKKYFFLSNFRVSPIDSFTTFRFLIGRHVKHSRGTIDNSILSLTARN